MRPANYSNQEIIDAGLAILKDFRPANGFSIKKALGGGNYTRIKQVWDEYLASQISSEKAPAPELPVEVAERLAEAKQQLVTNIESLVVDLNMKAVQASERRVTEVVRTAGEQREQAERALADAAETLEAIEQDVEDAKELIADLRNQLERSVGEKQSLAVELAQVKERLGAVEKSAEQSQLASSQRIQDLEKQLKEERQHTQVARDLESEARGALAAAEKQRATDAEVTIGLRLEVTQSREALSNERSKAATLEAELKQYEDQRQELNQVREDLSVSKSKLATQESQLLQLEKIVGEAQAALKDANAEAKAAIVLAAEAQGREKSALEQLAALTKQSNERTTGRAVKPGK